MYKNVTWKNTRSKYTLKLVILKYLHDNYKVKPKLLLTLLNLRETQKY